MIIIEMAFIGLWVVIALIAHKAKIIAKINWINFILILLFYFKTFIFEITNYGIFTDLV